jgi:hypothetical protein
LLKGPTKFFVYSKKPHDAAGPPPSARGSEDEDADEPQTTREQAASRSRRLLPMAGRDDASRSRVEVSLWRFGWSGESNDIR